MKRILLVLIFCLPILAQKYPTSVATDADLGVARNLATTTIVSGTGTNATTFTLTSATGFGNNMVVGIDNEFFFCPTLTGTVFSGCTPHFDGSSTATHNAGATIRGLITASYHNAMAAEIKAIEAALLNGPLLTGQGAGVAGAYDFGAGTAPAVPANSFGWGAGTTMTTSQRLVSPNAVTPAHSVMVFPAPTSNVSIWSYKAIPDCPTGIGFTQSSDTFGCGVPGSTAPGTNTTLVAPAQIYVCTSTCNITVPVPALNYQFCVMNGDNVSTVITLLGIGSSAMYENAARTGYGTAGTGNIHSNGAVKDSICILGIDSTHYLFASGNGTWTTT